MRMRVYGDFYAVDLKKATSFFTEIPSAAKPNSTSIQHVYTPLDDDDTVSAKAKADTTTISEKTVTDVKFGVNDNISQLRYSLLMSLIEMALTTDTDAELPSDMSPGQKIAFNTLVENGILYKIENNETEYGQE